LQSEDEEVLWWIFIALAGVSTIVYYVCLWFCIYDESAVNEEEIRKKVMDAQRRREIRL